MLDTVTPLIDLPTEDAMQKWTYMNERVPRENLMEFVRMRGQEGWELATVLQCDHDLVEVIYKRPEQ